MMDFILALFLLVVAGTFVLLLLGLVSSFVKLLISRKGADEDSCEAGFWLFLLGLLIGVGVSE